MNLKFKIEEFIFKYNNQKYQILFYLKFYYKLSYSNHF